jgi:MFS family permease
LTFSIPATAFEGLLLLRRRPLTLVWVLAVWFLGGVGSNLAPWLAPTRGPTLSPTAYGLSGLFLLLCLMGASAIVYARAPKAEGRAKPLRAWPRAILFLTLFWLLALILIVAWIVGTALAVRLFEQRVLPRGMIINYAVWPIIALVLGAVLIFWLSVRLACAGPIAFDRHQIAPRLAWRMTRGRTWRLVAVFLLALVTAVAIGVIMTMLRNWGETLIPLPITPPANLQAFVVQSFTTVSVAYSAYDALAIALITIVLFAPGARLYAGVAAETPQSRAAIFD